MSSFEFMNVEMNRLDTDSDPEESESDTPQSIIDAANNNSADLLPKKSGRIYKSTYEKFVDWKKKSKVKATTESAMLVYFSELAKSVVPPSLWSIWSMLKTTIMNNEKINICSYAQLKAFITKENKGYVRKKAKVLKDTEIERFLTEFSDDEYLLKKVVLVIGISGACRRDELYKITIKDVEDHNTFFKINLPKTKTDKPRSFIVGNEFYGYVKKYIALRPRNATAPNFFTRYQKRKCLNQVVGVHTIGSTPKEIAGLLGLENPELYTGRTFRRSSATLYVDTVIEKNIIDTRGNTMMMEESDGSELTEDIEEMKPLVATSYSKGSLILTIAKMLHQVLKQQEQLEIKILDIEEESFIQDINNSSFTSNRKTTDLILHYMELEKLKSKAADISGNLANENKEEMVQNVDDTTKQELEVTMSLIASIRRRLESISMDRRDLHTRMRANNPESTSFTPERDADGIDAASRLVKSPSTFLQKRLPDTLKRVAVVPQNMFEPKQPRFSTASTSTSVAEIISESTAQTDREQRMSPVFYDKDFPDRANAGITGLRNVGNTSYMNSIMQCISNSPYLARYFTDNDYLDNLNMGCNESRGRVTEEVAHVIKALWSGRYKSISPLDLKAAVEKSMPRFEHDNEQDAHQFLSCLLETLHNDLKKKVVIPPDMPMSSAQTAWNESMDSQKSIISDLIYGQKKSTIVCITCRNISTTFEVFNCLTVPRSDKRYFNLNDWMQNYDKPQRILNWDCPYCKCSRTAKKMCKFVKLPSIVVIHLNRFTKKGEIFVKNHTMVYCPSFIVDLNSYAVNEPKSVNTPDTINPRKYSLYAAVVHEGTMQNGHYGAICRHESRNMWYRYDDDVITEDALAQIRVTGYILFYKSS